MFNFLRTLFGSKDSARSIDIDFNIVGIGNIGEKYESTRHNIGFDAVQLLSEKLNGEDWKKECDSKVSITKLQSEKYVTSILPQTYVNRSGEAVLAVNTKYDIAPEKTLVVTDDFNIPLGTMRFRKKGSAGGHNGLKSIIESIGDGFPRLRLGVGPLPSGVSIIDFVLGKFDDDEENLKKKSVELAVEAIEFFSENGIEAAMNKYNGRDIRQ